MVENINQQSPLMVDFVDYLDLFQFQDLETDMQIDQFSPKCQQISSSSSTDLTEITSPCNMNSKEELVLGVVLDDCSKYPNNMKENKRIRYAMYIPHPKILKRDIRRSYAEMFVNCANANDINSMEGFFDTFSGQNLIYEQGNLAKPSHYLRLNGKALFLQLWFNRIHESPDTVVNISETKVHTYSNSEESKVSCVFNISKTKIRALGPEFLIPSRAMMYPYTDSSSNDINNRDSNTDCRFISSINDSISNSDNNVQSPLTTESKNPQLESKKRKACVVTPVATSEPQKIKYDTSIISLIDKAPLLAEPIDFRITGTMTMYLNPNKEISALTFTITGPSNEATANAIRTAFDCHFK